MPAAPDFRLYHSNALDVLAGLLADQVARPPADGDWLRPDVVLVPQFSMRRWLQQALAEHSGICANLTFLTPGEFVDLALDANLGPAPEADRLAPEVLRWHLLAQLRRDPPPALAGFLASPDPLRPWSLAHALAESFEKYQAWRRDWLLDWEREPRPRPGAEDWQAALWRRVAHGRRHRARRIDDYLRRVREPVGLPSRLFVFACQNISPDVLQLVARQARVGEQHFYLHTPARAFWGDLDRWRDYRPAQDDDFLGGAAAQAPNPLLAAWGQAGRDFVAGLVAGESVPVGFELAPHATPAADTLLGRLQQDVLDNLDGRDRAPDAEWPRPGVDRADPSLQLHACHTRLREVQVLHDQLRALLEAPAPEHGKRLQPRQIAVLAPDIDAYAPHIEAVFGGALGSDREIPYTIADTSPLASAPLAAAFLRLLDLPLRALELADVLDLLAVPAIAARFGIDDNARAALQGWLEAAGARWGLDAADREHHGARPEPAYTFQFALDRLLLGLATGADEEIAGVAPWSELEGQGTAALGGLLRLLEILRHHGTRLGQPHTPAGWGRELEQLLDAVFARRDEVDAFALKALRQAIAGFARGAQLAGFDAPVEHAVVLDHFRRELAASDARAPFLSGGVCFGRMVPMRLIPFQVICLLGMDEAAFPGRDTRDGVNLLAHELASPRRRVGDPSRRDADRYLFLQLFGSAGRVLYLSWCGMDPRDNSHREPSALVAELLDAAVDCHVADDESARREVRDALVVRHALQPFAPAAYGAAHADDAVDATVDPRRFSYDPRWREAAQAPLAAGAEPPFAAPGFALPARDEDDAVVMLDRLRGTLLRPQATWLRDGLGLRLPEDEAPLDGHEPMGAPDPLTHHKLREAVFDAWLRAGTRPDPAQLQRDLLARAALAPGADGHAAVEELLEEVDPFARQALDAGFGGAARRRAVQAPVGTRSLRGVLDGVHGDDDAPRLLRVALRAKGRHGNLVLRHGLDWLVASLLQLQVFELYKDDEDAPALLRPRPLAEPAQAQAALASLIALHDLAGREPLPFLPKSGHLLHATDDADAGLRAAGRQWCGEGFNATPERTAATQLALRGRDPFVDEDAAMQLRLRALSKAIFNAVEHAAAFALEDLR